MSLCSGGMNRRSFSSSSRLRSLGRHRSAREGRWAVSQNMRLKRKLHRPPFMHHYVWKQVSTLLQMPELFHVLHLSMLTQLAEWMPPVLPKAQAASLRVRRKFLGLRGFSDVFRVFGSYLGDVSGFSSRGIRKHADSALPTSFVYLLDEAAFKLALHLHHRHDMHGLARSGGQDARLMQSAWQRLNAELQAPCSTSVEPLVFFQPHAL